MIPVFLISFNRFTCLARMVEQLRNFPGIRPVIVDNASSYPPLLDYLARVDVDVIRLPEHLGKHAPWLSGLVPHDGWYAATDPDLDLSGCPTDLFVVMREVLEAHPWAIKAGTSLAIDDLPASAWRDDVITWENQFWQDRVDDRCFNAPIDTTLAVYRPGRAFDPANWLGPAIRLDRPYTARHLPWYATTPTAEDRYYAAHLISTTPHWSRRVIAAGS